MKNANIPKNVAAVFINFSMALDLQKELFCRYLHQILDMSLILTKLEDFKRVYKQHVML
jgi:hypothetical protein